MATTQSTASSSEAPGSFQLPWQAIPKFIPGTTDVTEYSRKLQFLAAMWPKEHLSLLAPRAALMCEGTSFKKVASLDASKLKANDESGVKLLVSTLGGSWGKTALEEKYDCFEKAIYGTIQKADETNDSYVARHDVHFEELLAGGVTLKEVRAYILLRQSQLTADDRKRIVVEMNGAWDYQKVCSAIRLLGSRFFTDLQGQRSGKTKTYDANYVDEGANEEPERALQASAPIASEDGDLDNEFMEALIAAEDHDAMQVQAFEEELEGFFQETPDLQEALVSYLEARGRLLAKKRSRGFWPVASSGKGSKGGRGFEGGKGKGMNAREQLLARISRSHCRACGERGHWKAECPKAGKSGAKGETATTTVAEVDEPTYTMIETAENPIAEISTSLPEGTLSLDEAHLAVSEHKQDQIKHRLRQVVENMRAFHPVSPETAAALLSQGPLKIRFCGWESKLCQVERPTGLYMVDLARLCVESDKEHHCQTVTEELVVTEPHTAPLLHVNQCHELEAPATRCLLRNHTSRQKANLCIKRKSQQLLSPSAPILHSRRALYLRCLPMSVSKGSLTLGARYAQLNDPQLRLSLDEMEAMSLEQLGELKIDFGRTMSGRTYMDVAINEQAWSKWIIEHMAKSTKKEHQAFLRFMERYVEEAEGVEASLMDALEASEPGRATARPKIAAKKGTTSRAAASSDMGPETWDLANDRERDSALDHQVTAPSTRVNQMESVMQQVLVAIQELNVDILPMLSTSLMKQAMKAVSEFWMSWAGQPHKFYLDPAGEFRSEEMLEKFQSMNSKVFISTAAWQRGRVERHGDIVKDMLARIDTQQPIVSDTSFDQALLVAFQAKNALVRHRGYSPEQIVLGKSVRIPGSLTSDEDLASHAITEGSDLEAEQHRVGELSEVERNPSLTAGSAAPSQVPAPTSVDPSGVLPSEPEPLNGMDIPIPESDEGLMTECVNLASAPVGEIAGEVDELFSFLTLQASKESTCPPVAEDNLPFVVDPLICSNEQAYCLEIPVSAKTLKRWAREKSPEKMSGLAAVSKRARSEVYVKDLSSAERALFETAKAKEISCWLQTSAIRPVLRRELNPEQILRSRWILTWKAPEPGEEQRRAKARLVVLGFQDPKLVDVLRDAPTLSKEGRALVLQTIASSQFPLSSFDIKTAFLRGKADESNPLAMEPPPEVRKALNLKDDEVCELLGNAYGRVDAPLLFYKELSKQLLQLGFTRHPLEPCVFMLYTGQKLNGILGVHVDDGVCGGDAKFSQKIQELEKKLPFGSRKYRSFVFTGIHLEQFPDFSIRAAQSDYVRNIPQIDIGRTRRQ
ncbi:RE1, partial [Symbiodinium sp. CCMP2456]